MEEGLFGPKLIFCLIKGVTSLREKKEKNNILQELQHLILRIALFLREAGRLDHLRSLQIRWFMDRNKQWRGEIQNIFQKIFALSV